MLKERDSISIIGLGYVGLPLALLADKNDYDVIGIDIDNEKLDLLSNGVSPFQNNELNNDLTLAEVQFSDDFSNIATSHIVIICVPTPVRDDLSPNLEPIEAAVRSVGEHLQADQLIVLESTVNPGVTDDIVIPLLEQQSGMTSGDDFYVAYCPERINPGDEEWNVGNIPRVIGSVNKEGLDRAVSFYRSIIDAEVKPMDSIRETEAVKIVENCFRDINIAFVNELARSFDKVGIDVLNVIEGAATKPFGYMPFYPGNGVGGHCIPVDPYYLIDYAKKNGFDHELITLGRSINRQMPSYIVDLLRDAFIALGLDKQLVTIGMLGLSYKKGISDTRESPAFTIREILQDENFSVEMYDPYVPEESSSNSLDELLKIASVILICTDHKEFTELQSSVFKENGVVAVIDGKNCLSKKALTESGLYYKGVGR